MTEMRLWLAARIADVLPRCRCWEGLKEVGASGVVGGDGSSWVGAAGAGGRDRFRR